MARSDLLDNEYEHNDFDQYQLIDKLNNNEYQYNDNDEHDNEYDNNNVKIWEVQLFQA